MEGIPRDTPELQEFLSGLPRQPNDRYPHVRHLRQFDVFHYNAADCAVNVAVENQGPRVIGSFGSSSSVAPPAPASPPSKPPGGGEEAPKPMQVLLRLEKRGQGL
eukprot:5583160-Amphidinium_carterae.1